ncbi:PQQ-binding-like beta-propeller repeat protein, partial [Candidatus Latescibacterota bacterium]
GTIYVGCKDSYLYAVTPWGTIKWKFESDNLFATSSPSIGSDGTIYATAHGLRLYAINPDGTEKWNNYLFDNPKDSSPVIAADGTIYMGIADDLRAFNSDGTNKWEYDMGTYADSTPIIGTDGIVYYIGPERNGVETLNAFNPDGSINWEYEIYQTEHDSQLGMSSDGTLYVGTDVGLYAFQTDSQGFEEDSPWPTFMHNNTRSVATGDNVLPDLYTVSGQVSLSDTLLNGGILISVDGLATETLEDGSFSLNLPDGQYELEIQTDTLELPNLIDFVVNGSDKIVLMEQGTYAVSGYISTKGEPVVGLSVSILDQKVFTNENGMFSFELGNGTYTINLDLDKNSFPNSREITVDGTDMVLADFEINRFMWEYEIGYKTYELPAFDTDGSILLFPKESGIHHLNADGTYLDNYPQMGGMSRVPSQGEDGTFYVPGWNNLVAWTPLGGVQWTLEIEELGFGAPPAIGFDGTLYLGSNENLYAVNPEDGTVLWTFPCGIVGSSPSIAQDGTIYVSSYDNHIYALNPDGTEKWNYESNSPLGPTPIIGRDGTIYVGGYDNIFHALNPDGSLKWKYETRGAICNVAVIDAEGTIYFVNQNDYLYALNSDGTFKWKFYLEEGWGACSVVITEQNTIFAASKEGVLRNIDLDGSLIWEHHFEDCDILYPSLADDGTMYLIMNEDHNRIGYIRAFQTSTEGYQKTAAWPCFMANSQRTGNAIDMVTNVEQEFSEFNTDDVPVMFALKKNFPNPFNMSTTISFSLPTPGNTTITVFSSSGQKVATLIDEYKEAGYHSVQFDGNNLATGIYFYRMESPGYMGTEKMLLIK